MSLSLTFLRPLALPRPSTLNHFLRPSCAPQSTPQPQIAKASTASPPGSSPRKPSAAKSPSSRTSPKAPSTPSHLPTTTPTAPKPYHVTKTLTAGLPVYHLSKRGGNKHQTKLRRIEGDILALKSDLQRALELDDKEIVVNQLTQHIVIKGHKRTEVVKFLEDNNLAEDR